MNTLFFPYCNIKYEMSICVGVRNIVVWKIILVAR